MHRRLGSFSSSSPPPTAQQQVVAETLPRDSQPSSSNLSPSLIIIAIILTFVFVISASIHLLLRYLNRRCNTSVEDNDDVATNEPVHVNHTSTSRRRVVPQEDRRSLIDSLPLFSFNSISKLPSSSSSTTTSPSPSGDCAVCLSKFEPHDQLRLLPICCHAFHSSCIDTWLASNHTCPLCRSTVHVNESDCYLKLISSSSRRSESFRVEIGNVSSRRIASDSGNDRRRSYSIGSFDYIVEDETSEIAIEPIHRREDSESTFGGKKDEISSPEPGMNPRTPGSEIAAEVASGRGWLKDYIDRLASSSSASSISSRALSFRFSERFFTGSSRRSESFTGSSRRSNNSAVGAIVNGGNWDLEGNRYGEEIGSFLRWLSGVY